MKFALELNRKVHRKTLLNYTYKQLGPVTGIHEIIFSLVADHTMAALTSMEQLPLDVLECIVGYLSDKDLSRCCTTSKSWREVFSGDIFWKKHCNIKLSVCLESASCLVEPHFITPSVLNSSLVSVSGWRLCFLREQHCLKNLRSGRYTRKEIEFDCDDSISYHIKVEFVANNYVFLHTTYETQVWNVVQEPNLVMTIPFQLVELWERNFHKFQENKLIVVQCNVVQMFNICLLSNTWSFHRTLFFDKPEEFSSNITKDTDVNELFQTTSHEVGDSVERVICSNFLIGIVTTEMSLQNPVMHIWDLNSCKKIKEEDCSEIFGSGVTDMYLETSTTSHDKIIVTCQKYQKKCFAVYSLTKLKFLAIHQCRNGESVLCAGYLCIYDNSNKEILKYDLNTNITETVYKFDQGRLNCWKVICDKMVVANSNNLILLNPLSKAVEIQSCDDFQLGNVEVVKDKYLALHDRDEGLREFSEHRAAEKLTRNNQNTFIKLFSLPPDSGTYRANNEICTKLVLERANKLIILNFW